MPRPSDAPRLDTDNPFFGKPLELRPMAFKLTAEERMRGAMGVPAWILRRKRLERRMQALEHDLRVAWELTHPAAWEARARAWDLSAVNQEIDHFNRFYPIERNLPMDVRRREMVEGDTAWRPLPPLDPTWILERFPASGAGCAAAPDR